MLTMPRQSRSVAVLKVACLRVGWLVEKAARRGGAGGGGGGGALFC
jgi:hypothetical protein